MRVFWISAVVVLADQVTKAAVLNFMYRQQSIPLLGDWLKLTFTENPGMAFGLQIGPPGMVTVLSIIATVLVVYYLYQVRRCYTPYRASLALILGGAIGNIIDRVFYAPVLGYGELFTGRVVDFIHVSLWQGFIPKSVPFVGGAYLELFPIWNVADMAIVIGVVGVLLFHRVFHERLYAEQMRRARGAPHAASSEAVARAVGGPFGGVLNPTRPAWSPAAAPGATFEVDAGRDAAGTDAAGTDAAGTDAAGRDATANPTEFEGPMQRPTFEVYPPPNASRTNGTASSPADPVSDERPSEGGS